MTSWEKRILELLADRYPSAAAATGGRFLRLRPDGNFPDLAGAGADDTESFLEAAETLEKKGIVSLVWEKHRKGEILKSLTLENPDALFALLARPSPVSVLEGAKSAAREIAERAPGVTAGSAPGETVGADGAAFFGWLSRNLRPEDAAAGIDAASVRALGTLSAALSQDATGGMDAGGGAVASLTPRALSVRLFSDSKYLENLLYRTRFLLQRAEYDGVPVPDFSALARSFPETMLAGRFVLEFADAAPLVNATGMIIGLPAASVRLVSAVRSSGSKQPASVLSVENKETFYALASGAQSAGPPSAGFDCVLYTAGHPNPAVCALLDVFARSGFVFFHAGDLDPDGIIILQEVMRAAGRPVNPFGMDAAVFERYLPYARDLTAGMLSRFVQLADETRALAGIEALVERILSTGKGVEQEVIDYPSRSTPEKLDNRLFPLHNTLIKGDAMTDQLEFSKVDGTDTRRDIEIYALSTCGFCKRALGFLDSNKIAYRYVHLDELPLETKARVKQELSVRFNRQISFPFAIIDDKEYLVGFIEIDWRNTLLGAAANAPK